MKPQDYYVFSAFIFLSVFVLHGFRVIYEWNAVLGGWVVPMWVSWAVFIIAGSFAYFGLRLGGFFKGGGRGRK